MLLILDYLILIKTQSVVYFCITTYYNERAEALKKMCFVFSHSPRPKGQGN